MAHRTQPSQLLTCGRAADEKVVACGKPLSSKGRGPRRRVAARFSHRNVFAMTQASLFFHPLRWCRARSNDTTSILWQFGRHDQLCGPGRQAGREGLFG